MSDILEFIYKKDENGGFTKVGINGKGEYICHLYYFDKEDGMVICGSPHI